MADTKHYKVLKDISIPRALRALEERLDGSISYQNVGVNYAEGDVVSSADITPPVLERVENGEFEDFLEEVSGDELEALLAVDPERSTFIPEHEAENVVLKDYGHETLGKDAALEAYSAGAEDAAAAIEAAHEAGTDERPGLTLGASTDLAEASREGTDVVVEEDDAKPHTPKRAPRRKKAEDVDSPQTDQPSGAGRGKRAQKQSPEASE